MQPILITGATGTLGRAFARVAGERGLRHVVTARDELDLADETSIAAALGRWNPWLVINAAGYVRVDDAESDEAACRRCNADGAARLARLCADDEIGFVTFSSDLVFDGAKGAPYDEDDPVAPLNAYGRSKATAEELVRTAHPGALVIRTAAFFGPWDEHNVAAVTLRELAAGRAVVAANDVVVSPTYLPDLVHATLDLAIDGEHGLWHLASAGATPWSAFARTVAERAGLPPDLVDGTPAARMPWAARRPAYSALTSRRGAHLPSLDDAIDRFVATLDRRLSA